MEYIIVVAVENTNYAVKRKLSSKTHLSATLRRILLRDVLSRPALAPARGQHLKSMNHFVKKIKSAIK